VILEEGGLSMNSYSFEIDLACANETRREIYKNKQLLDRVDQIHSAYGIWPAFALYAQVQGNDVLDATMGEASADTIDTVISVMHGLYKSAVHSLRSIFELVARGLYHGAIPSAFTPLPGVKENKPGFSRTVWTSKAIDVISKDRRVATIKQYFATKGQSLRVEMRKLYGELCVSSHSHPKIWESSRWNDIVPRFNQGAFNEWYSLAQQTIGMCFTLLFAFHSNILHTPNIKEDDKNIIKWFINDSNLEHILGL
jgi:hypothetical protein